MFTLAIGTVPSSNVPVQVLLPRRGIAAACPGALVRPLPRVLAVVGVQVLLRRPSIAAAWPGARVEPKACPIILAYHLLPLRLPLHPDSWMEMPSDLSTV